MLDADDIEIPRDSIVIDDRFKKAARIAEKTATEGSAVDLETIVASAIGHEPTLAGAPAVVQAALLAAGLALAVRPTLGEDDWITLWAPIGETIPFASVWAPRPGEPPEFESGPAKALSAVNPTSLLGS